MTLTGLGAYPTDSYYDPDRPSWLPYWIDDSTESAAKYNSDNIVGQMGGVVGTVAGTLAGGVASGVSTGLKSSLDTGGVWTIAVIGIGLYLLLNKK